MAASNVAEPSVQPQDEVDLTDEQIQQLLLEAEGRLRGPDTQSTELDIASLRYDPNPHQPTINPHRLRPVNANSSTRIPKLSSGSSLQPYVEQKDDVSTAKTSELVDKRYKELSNKLHTTSGLKPAVQVRRFFPPDPVSPPPFHIAMRKIFPKRKALDAASAVRFGLCCTSESFIFHSYSEQLPLIHCHLRSERRS